MKREVVLDTAKRLVNNDRVKHYGSPKENFTRIANMWSEIFKTKITPAQVALCMAIVKVTRLIQTPDHEDSWIDLAGYAACGGEVVEPIMQPKVVHYTNMVQQVKPEDVLPAMFGGMKDE